MLYIHKIFPVSVEINSDGKDILAKVQVLSMLHMKQISNINPNKLVSVHDKFALGTQTE